MHDKLNELKAYIRQHRSCSWCDMMDWDGACPIHDRPDPDHCADFELCDPAKEILNKIEELSAES